MSAESKLKAVFQNLAIQSRQDFKVGDLKLASAKLPTIAEAISISRSQPKPPRNENIIRSWQESVSQKQTGLISNRDLRYLSWEPDVACSKDYLEELQRRNFAITRSVAKGFAYSVMSKWNSPDLPFLIGFIARNLEKEGVTSYLPRIAPLILDTRGPQIVATTLTKKLETIPNTISAMFGITSTATEYNNTIIKHVIEKEYQMALSTNQQEKDWFYLNILKACNKQNLLNCLEKIVSAIDKNQNEKAKDDLKHFVLTHPNLGDPRLPGFEGNWPHQSAVTNKVIEWLSQSDIKFFFDLFIENKTDNQGRKQFWLKYAHRVRGSRVIVSENDKRKFARQISEMKQKGGVSNLFANLKEKNERSTVFMMDFGSLIVVEFGHANHACYYYNETSRFKYQQKSMFWNTPEFSMYDLKNKDICEKPLRHVEGWEQTFSNMLARYGIRTGTGRY